MPIEIVDMRFFYMFPDKTACKVLTATNFVFTISSGLILIAIAMERYRRICLPFNKQLTVFQARLICFISVIIACVLSWPSLIFYTIVDVDVPIPGTGVIKGYDCTTVKEDSLKVYLNAFNVLQILLFIFTVLPLIFLYVLVYRQLNKLKQFQKYRSREVCISPKTSRLIGIDDSSTEKLTNNKDTSKLSGTNTMVSISENSENQIDGPNMAKNFLTQGTSEGEVSTSGTSLGSEDTKQVCESNRDDEIIKPTELEQTNILSQQKEQNDPLEQGENVETGVPDVISKPFKNDNVTGESGKIRLVSGYSLHKRKPIDLNSVTYTTLMLVITITFIVSFLPYLCLVVWRSLSTGFVEYKMTDLQLIFYSTCIRSYFLNSALNPIIYGFFNSQFRTFFTSVCCFWSGTKFNCKRRSKRTDVDYIIESMTGTLIFSTSMFCQSFLGRFILLFTFCVLTHFGSFVSKTFNFPRVEVNYVEGC
ncbi:hypothetical protein CHS0354_039259 [Potamilus streckersoni]|uniref:G-protein coupled receptors family 1 profile domain-containing protein n=1 Tax=Potamilus streckersoni TaxID=2493646 RepID=A0AAE0S3G5_9BIVA|nr:hypothetical protein CHS0354_039259 [Potamilus streckersoni]